MKKIAIVKIIIVFCILSSVSLAAIIFAKKTASEQDVTFKVFAEKDSYLIGEPVKLKVEVFNNGLADISFTEPHESRLWISKDKKNYKFHDGNPRDDSVSDFFTLQPNQSWEINLLPFLWNGKPNYSRLVGDTKFIEETDKQTKIITDYIFQDPGIYYATVRVKFKTEKTQKESKIEAEPTEIVIKEPIGDDLEVWKKIQNNINFAYLMQYGKFAESTTKEKRTDMIQEAEQIIISHPNSIYSSYLKQGLEKLKKQLN